MDKSIVEPRAKLTWVDPELMRQLGAVYPGKPVDYGHIEVQDEFGEPMFWRMMPGLERFVREDVRK